MGNRIVCVIHRRNDKILHVAETLERMGNEVKLLYWDDYAHVCSYWKKKIYKLGFKQGEKDYLLKWKKNFHMLVEDFSPTHILFVDYALGFLDTEDLRAVKGKANLICWFIDSIRRMEDLSVYYPLMDNVWVFEEADISILREDCNVEAKFIAVGYNSDYEYRAESNHKTMDVCFVGAPYKNRLKILETIIEQSNSKIAIYGPFYEEKYFWKKYLFKRKYPRIYSCLHNGFFSSMEIADIYMHSKICLNIHLQDHKGISPRSYEIMATKSFELMDEREEYGAIIQPGRNVVVYHDVDDLLQKIEYYVNTVSVKPSGVGTSQ